MHIHTIWGRVIYMKDWGQKEDLRSVNAILL